MQPTNESESPNPNGKMYVNAVESGLVSSTADSTTSRRVRVNEVTVAVSSRPTVRASLDPIVALFAGPAAMAGIQAGHVLLQRNPYL